MKLSRTLLVMSLGIASGAFTGCPSSNNSAENSPRQERSYTSEVSHDAQENAKETYEDFVRASEKQIVSYEKTIAEYKVIIAKEQRREKALYERKLAEAEQANRDMKTRLANYKDDGKAAWRSFKSEFNRDMDKLGVSISNVFTSNNEK